MLIVNSTGRCDIYLYGGSAGLNLRVVLDGSDVIVSIIREGLKYSVKYCEADRGYVLTAAPALTSKTGYKLREVSPAIFGFIQQ